MRVLSDYGFEDDVVFNNVAAATAAAVASVTIS